MASRKIEIRQLVRDRLNRPEDEQVIRNKLTGRTAMDPGTLQVINDELGIVPEGEAVLEPKALYSRALGTLRILGGVSAGLGWEATDEDAIEVPISLCGPSRVGWIVRGDSMIPLLQEGDVAIFESGIVPKLNVPNLVRTRDTEYRVKMVRHDGERYCLWSLNPSYPEEPADGSWLGYLVGFYRLIGSREEMMHDPSGLRPQS